MKRRKFLDTSISTTTGVAIGVAGTYAVLAQPRIHWRMATSWPTDLDTIYGGAETICDRVSKMTNGRFTITPYPAGPLAPALKVLNAVQVGKVQCGHTASYYYTDKNPALAFATGVPFGLNAQQQKAWLYYGGGLEEIQNIYAQYGVINFPAGNTGTQMGGWFKQQVNTIQDFQGLRMRIPGLGGLLMAKLGVQVKDIASNEIFQALNENKIDAAEWIGPYDDLKLGLNEVAKYYYYPGWWDPASTFDVLVNLKQWNDLPPEYQEIFKTAAFEANAIMLAKYDALNQTALKTLINSGTILEDFSKDIMDAALVAARNFYKEEAEKDATFKQLYGKWNTFRNKIYQWHKVNELKFAEFALESDPL